MELQLEKAIFKKGGITPGKLSRIRIEVWATMTVKIAKELGAKWLLFNNETVIRDGFRNVELDADFATASVVHKIDRISEITMEGCHISKFVARASKPTKKKAKKINISFLVDFTGNNLFLMEHWNKVQTGEGVLVMKIIEQAKLDMEKTGGKKVEMSPKQKQGTLEVMPAPVAAATAAQDVDAKLGRVKYAGNGKDFTAVIEYGDETDFLDAGSPEKFAAMVTATIGAIRIKGQIELGHDSERDALQTAAKCVYDAACKLAATTKVAKQKAEAGKMADWAVKYITADKLKDGPEGLTPSAIDAEL